MTLEDLPVSGRVVFYAGLLLAIGAGDALSDDFYVPLAVLVILLLAGIPIAGRLFGRGREPVPADAKPSGRIVVAFAAALTAIVVVETALIPDFGLGPIFWIVADLIPPIELHRYLARREARTRADSASSS